MTNIPPRQQKPDRESNSSLSRDLRFFDLDVSTYLAAPARSLEECFVELVGRVRQSRPAPHKRRLAHLINALAAEADARGLRLDETSERFAVPVRRESSDRRTCDRRTSLRRQRDRRDSERRVLKVQHPADERRQQERRALNRRIAERRTGERRSGERRVLPSPAEQTAPPPT